MKTNPTNARLKAKVYAEVLLEASKTGNKVFDVNNQFSDLIKAVRSSLELRKTLADRTIPSAVKKALIEEIFSGFAPELLATFTVLVDRGDLSLLSRAQKAYAALAEQALGATFIDVTTVVPLDENLRKQIIAKYAKQLGCDVLLREHIDSNLIGGIVLSTHGKRIDASVLSQLESARHALSKA